KFQPDYRFCQRNYTILSGLEAEFAPKSTPVAPRLASREDPFSVRGEPRTGGQIDGHWSEVGRCFFRWTRRSHSCWAECEQPGTEARRPQCNGWSIRVPRQRPVPFVSRLSRGLCCGRPLHLGPSLVIRVTGPFVFSVG